MMFDMMTQDEESAPNAGDSPASTAIVLHDDGTGDRGGLAAIARKQDVTLIETEAENINNEGGSMPWPMPPARSQHVFMVTALWMCFPLVMLAAPTMLLWNAGGDAQGDKRPTILVSTYFWIFSVIMSVVHWGRYVARGPAQILDVVAAAASGVCIVVETALYIRAPARIGVWMTALVVTSGLGYCESKKPTWDGMNGFLFHNALRYSATWMFACIAGRPSPTDACAGAAGWTLLLTASCFIAHVAVEVYLVNGAAKTQFAYTRSTEPSQLQPSILFKALGLVRAMLVVGGTLLINRAIWGSCSARRVEEAQ